WVGSWANEILDSHSNQWTRREGAPVKATGPEGERFTIFLQGIAALLGRGIGHLERAGNNAPARLLYALEELGRDQASIEVVDGVADAVVLQPIDVNPSREPSLGSRANRIEDRYVDSLDHAREDLPRLYPVLVRVRTYRERAALSRCIED